jgi:hypothetical protein
MEWRNASCGAAPRRTPSRPPTSRIRTSYEAAYEPFAPAVAEPGCPLGYLFLDKLFQLTVPVPTLSPQAQKDVLKELLRTTSAGPAKQAIQEVRAVRHSVQESGSEAEVVVALQKVSPTVSTSWPRPRSTDSPLRGGGGD